ncbi:MAG: NAD-dependent protein deacylase [Deltaproteobacteria bacterium]|nr:NAD-dependent protein deacylase [Deltaproteobacteria bacterium]
MGEEGLIKAAAILSRSTRTVASCGAGVSAESGIATFRDVGGIWDRIDPMEVGTPDGLIRTLQRDAGKLLPLFMEILDSFEGAEPNRGHFALADLEKMGVLKTVITQNADNLHQEAGSTDVIEVHGNVFRMKCLACNTVTSYDRKPLIGRVRETINSLSEYTINSLMSIAPRCSVCGFITRPDVVMFGEAVQNLPRALKCSAECDVMLVLGTSGVVYPAAAFPMEAKKAGSQVIVINPTENAFSSVSDVYIPMRTGEALPRIVELIKGKTH